MANIYDINAALTQPNIVGNFDQGVQTAQNNALAASKQQAIDQAQQDQQTLRQLAPAIQGGSASAYSQAAAIDPAAANAQQGAGDAQFQRMQGAIKFINNQPTPQAKEAAYQQAKPFFASAGGVPPDTYAQAQPIIDQIAAHIATLPGGGQGALTKVDPNQTVIDGNGKVVYSAPGIAAKPELVTDQKTGLQYWATPGGPANPIPINGATAPGGTSAPGSALANLPAETQAYVPKVKALLNGAPAFDAQGQPTPELLNSIRMVESGGNNNAVSQAGAQGPYQFMPATAASVGVANPFDPDQSRQGAAQYLAQIYKQVGNDPDAAIAAYNAGPGAVQKAQAAANGSAGGNAGFLTAKPKDAYTQLTPDEVTKAGLPAGTVAQRGSDGKIDVVSKADPSLLPAVPIGDQTKTGSAYLSSIGDSGLQNQIQAIAEGRMPLPKVSRPGKNGEITPEALQQAVAQYDPSFDQGDVASRLKARNYFTTGAGAQQAKTLTTLIGHLNGLSGAIDQLDNNNSSPDLNAVENFVGEHTGSTKQTNFDSAAGPVSSEFATLLKGGVPAEGEINAQKSLLNTNRTTSQLNGTVGTMAAQAMSRLQALDKQKQQALGPFASKVQILDASGREALQNLRNKGLIGDFDVDGQSSTNPEVPSSGSWSIQKVTP